LRMAASITNCSRRSGQNLLGFLFQHLNEFFHRSSAFFKGGNFPLV
jgi:hypothetical protein